MSAALALYAGEQAPTTAAPERIGYALDPLLAWWGDAPVSTVTIASCRRYAAERARSAGTTRRELGVLRAAMRYAVAAGHLSVAPTVTLPEPPPPRERWLTRSEAARLLRAARKSRAPGLARFILIGLYTGTRSKAILGLRFEPHVQGGWIDVERGVLHRRSATERQTAKRKPPAPLPRSLRAHCRVWARDGGWVIGWQGGRVASIKTAWNKARADAGLFDVTPHTLRHTAITWAMQGGSSLGDAAGYFGVSMAELERTYWHHHPDYQASAREAVERGGRRA